MCKSSMFRSSDMANLKPSDFSIISRIFGMGWGLCFNCIFKCRKFLRNCTQWFFLPLVVEKMELPIPIHFHVQVSQDLIVCQITF